MAMGKCRTSQIRRSIGFIPHNIVENMKSQFLQEITALINTVWSKSYRTDLTETQKYVCKIDFRWKIPTCRFEKNIEFLSIFVLSPNCGNQRYSLLKKSKKSLYNFCQSLPKQDSKSLIRLSLESSKMSSIVFAWSVFK
jgi:hypothetical protein